MTSQRDAHLENSRSIQAELLQNLDGMDYCLDWKPEPSAWSTREVVYHLLDTPPGGVHRVLRGIISGDLAEYDLWADQSNMTAEQRGYDLEQVRHDIGEFFRGMEAALESASDADLSSKVIVAHLRSRGVDDERTAQVLLERGFDRHWREHLEQIRTLRESLGM